MSRVQLYACATCQGRFGEVQTYRDSIYHQDDLAKISLLEIRPDRTGPDRTGPDRTGGVSATEGRVVWTASSAERGKFCTCALREHENWYDADMSGSDGTVWSKSVCASWGRPATDVKPVSCSAYSPWRSVLLARKGTALLDGSIMMSSPSDKFHR
jgi:hypothetical protein